jgi:HlyD family secretion protein
MILGCLVAAGLLAGIFTLYLRTARDDARSVPLLVAVERRPYKRVVVHQGEVESSRNVEIRCEVRPSEVRTRETRAREVRIGAIGTTGLGTTELGASGIGTSGTSRVGSSGLGSGLGSGVSTSGAGASGTSRVGTSGVGTSGVGTSGVGTSGVGTSGLGTSRLGTSRLRTSRARTTRARTSRAGASGVGSSGVGSGVATGRASTSIIDVISEGTQVEKGDWLITFDSSPLEQGLSRQRIAVNKIEATMIQSKAFYETAVIALDEYLKGTYNQQRKTIENQVFVAEDFLKRTQLAYDSVDRLVSRDLLTSLQLEGEQARVQSAQNDLDLAKQRLDALDQYTKTKMVVQLESDIRAAKVTYRNTSASYEEELKILKDVEDQIVKCGVTAPQAGQVVYANVHSRRGGPDFVVEPGAPVRERQVILHLPDPFQMQVRATVTESRVNLLREGMRVDIHLDAFREIKLKGEITKVSSYAEAGSFWSSSAKEYVTLISIEDPPPDIRGGLTAEVEILVESRENALTLPVQAIYERDRRTYCIVQEGMDFVIREIVIDSTDGEVVSLDEEQSDLEPGEQVVVHPRRHLDLIDQSRFPDPRSEQLAIEG